MSQNLLLEIGTEEIPAHVMPSLLAQLKKLGEDNLGELRLSFDGVKTMGTPRRLALIVTNLSEAQADLTEENRGPSVKIAFDADGNPTKAAQGFARGQGVDAKDLVVKDGYVYAKVHKVGARAKDLLPDLMPKIIGSLTFPNSMRWGAHDYKFIRPIRWLVGLYGTDVIDFSAADVKSGRVSRGHRFLSQGDFTVDSADSYEAACEKNFVIVDQDKRKAMIREQIEKAASAQGGVAEITEDLLEEVLYLVEYPTALVGKFDADYLKLPEAAVITPMRDHQRYFPIKKAGRLMPMFITVRNGGTEHLDTVRQGNERVLKARLEDAKFFFDEDCKKSLAEHRERLHTLVFQEGLGSVYAKSERLAKLTEFLADELKIDGQDKKDAIRAAELAKADLVTGMVTEFTELQGVMGKEYARLSGETEAVATAIDEHYLPRFAGDNLPATVAGRLVSLADKVDTIAGTFSRGKIPTGSQDPFALRRQALGLVLTLIEAKYNISLTALFDRAMDLYDISDENQRGKLRGEWDEFIRLRLKNVLDNSHIRYDIADAVLADVSDVCAAEAKARAWQEFFAADGAILTVQTWLRPVNIAAKETGDGSAAVDANLFGTEEEKNLYAAFCRVKDAAGASLEKHDYTAVLSALTQLRQPVAEFFDKVMVMDENPDVRRNRLALMSEIARLLGSMGDITKLVV